MIAMRIRIIIILDIRAEHILITAYSDTLAKVTRGNS